MTIAAVGDYIEKANLTLPSPGEKNVDKLRERMKVRKEEKLQKQIKAAEEKARLQKEAAQMKKLNATSASTSIASTKNNATGQPQNPASPPEVKKATAMKGSDVFTSSWPRRGSVLNPARGHNSQNDGYIDKGAVIKTDHVEQSHIPEHVEHRIPDKESSSSSEESEESRSRERHRYHSHHHRSSSRRRHHHK